MEAKMGVTIHYEGQVRDQASYEQMTAFAEMFATRQAWKTEPVRPASAAPGPDRHRTTGLRIFPHESSEPVFLEFDGEYRVQGSTKTQFAPARVHIQVIELLRAIQPF